MPSFICVRCGKTQTSIHSLDEWVYRDGRGFYCIWTCYNHRNDKKPKAQHPKSIPIIQYDKSGNVVKTFDSLVEAANHINGVAKSISRVCKTRTPYKGYLWRYKNDVS